MKKIPYIFILAIVLGLFACHSKSERIDDTDSTALCLALMPTMDNLPLYYAKEAGIFDSLGLSIKLVTYSSAMDCDTAFRNGKADGVVSDIVKANIWRANGDSIRVVMSSDLSLFLMTARTARIKHVNSIKEKLFAVTRNSALDFCADKLLEHVKLGALQLNRPQINNVELRCRMLEQNQYDGALLPEPYALKAEAQGAYRLLDFIQLTENLSAVIFHDSICIARSNDIKLLIEGYNTAVEVLNDRVERGEAGFESCIHSTMIDEIPDSIIHYPIFKKASMPSKKIVQSTAEWAKGRLLIEKESKYEDIIWQ